MLRDSHFSWSGIFFLITFPHVRFIKFNSWHTDQHCLLLKLSNRFIGIREASRALKSRTHASTDSARWQDTVPVSQYFSQPINVKLMITINLQKSTTRKTVSPSLKFLQIFGKLGMIHGNSKDKLSPSTFDVSIRVAT